MPSCRKYYQSGLRLIAPSSTFSGANVCAALQTARPLGPAARVVTILCDRAERYYSTSLFAAPGTAMPEPEPEASYAIGI